MKCLIINDEKDSWEILKKYISKAVEVDRFYFTENGEEGFSIAKEELPDFIILDFVIPMREGFKILNALKEDSLTQKIPVVGITEKVNAESSQIRAIFFGADSFVCFPFPETELLVAINLVLSQKSNSFLLDKHRENLKSFQMESVDEMKLDERGKEYLSKLKRNYSDVIDLTEGLIKERSETRKILKALRVSEEKYRVLFDEDRDMIFLTVLEERKYVLTDVNKTAEKMLGKRKHDLLTIDVFTLFKGGKEFLDRMFYKLLHNEIEFMELVLVSGRGEEIDVEVNAYELRIEGKSFFYISCRDIRLRNKMLNTVKKLSQAIELSPISVIITDVTGNIEYVNDYFLETTGYDNDEVIGKNPRILKSGIHPDEFYTDLWKTITGGDVWFGEICNKKKNGELYWENAVITPITDKEGVIINFVALKDDITQVKKLIEELRVAKDDAERANKLKSEFLARISHEIRTPLNVLINYANLLVEELIDEPDEFIMQSKRGINIAGKRLIRTIDLILDLAMLETGSYELNIKENNIEEIVKNISKEYYGIAQEKGLNFNVKILAKDNVIKCDCYSLEQILVNLLDNAFKFTRSGSVTIYLDENSQGQKIITVEDTGVGIDKGELNEIFDPFYQTEKGYSREYEGLGVGLSVVKRYCDLNNIKLTVESEKGKGSKFALLFDNQV